MTQAFKDELRQAIIKAGQSDPGEVYPEAFFTATKGHVLKSVDFQPTQDGLLYPRTINAFLTRKGDLVCVTQTGHN